MIDADDRENTLCYDKPCEMKMEKADTPIAWASVIIHPLSLIQSKRCSLTINSDTQIHLGGMSS